MNFYMTHQVERRSEVFISSAYRVDDDGLGCGAVEELDD